MKKIILTILIVLLIFLSSCQSIDNDSFCSDDNILISGVCYDKTSPVILGVEDLDVFNGKVFDPLDGITAIDDVDGDITEFITIDGEVNVNAFGMYFLKYSVIDIAGNKTTEVRYITVISRVN